MILQGDTYDMKVLHMTGIFSFTEWIHIFLQLFLSPNGSILLDRMTQALTLSGPQSKSSSNVSWFLLLLWALVTITLLLIYGLCFLKLPVKTCLLLITTDLASTEGHSSQPVKSSVQSQTEGCSVDPY